jgi:hypothetical protein
VDNNDSTDSVVMIFGTPYPLCSRSFCNSVSKCRVNFFSLLVDSVFVYRFLFFMLSMINSQYDNAKLAIIVGAVYCENAMFDALDDRDATIAMGIDRGWIFSCSSPVTGRPYEM